jgi:hypothetical protein
MSKRSKQLVFKVKAKRITKSCLEEEDILWLETSEELAPKDRTNCNKDQEGTKRGEKKTNFLKLRERDRSSGMVSGRWMKCGREGGLRLKRRRRRRRRKRVSLLVRGRQPDGRTQRTLITRQTGNYEAAICNTSNWINSSHSAGVNTSERGVRRWMMHDIIIPSSPQIYSTQCTA